MKLCPVEHFHNIFVFTFGRDCWILVEQQGDNLDLPLLSTTHIVSPVNDSRVVLA